MRLWWRRQFRHSHPRLAALLEIHGFLQRLSQFGGCRCRRSLGRDHHVAKVRAWRAQRETADAAWSDAAFSIDTWLQLTPTELAELSEQIVSLLRQWSTRDTTGEGAQRQPVFVFAYGVPATP